MVNKLYRQNLQHEIRMSQLSVKKTSGTGPLVFIYATVSSAYAASTNARSSLAESAGEGAP